MNKKYSIYKTLMILLLIHQSSFTMQSPLPHAIAFSTFYSALGYGIAKGIALWKVRTAQEAPENVQLWARDILNNKNISHANSVPLKLGNSWLVCGGSFIQIDQESAERLEKNLTKKQITSDEETERALAERSLLHEAKHYQNNDFSKGLLTHNLSIIPLVFSFFSPVKKIIYVPNIAKLLIAIGLPVVNYITFTRYQEAEADRFAFMNLSSIKKLEMNRDRKLEHAELFEFNVINYPYSSNKNWFENKIRSILFNKIHHLDQKLLNCSNNQSKHIIRQKNILITIANFIYDHQHPSFRRQVTIADECLKKRYIIENHS